MIDWIASLELECERLPVAHANRGHLGDLLTDLEHGLPGGHEAEALRCNSIDIVFIPESVQRSVLSLVWRYEIVPWY